MSYSIVLSNGLPISITFIVLGKTYEVSTENSITIMGVTNGTQVQILTDRDIVVRYTNLQEQNSLVDLFGVNTPFFTVNGSGTYGIYLAGESVVKDQVTLKDVIDRILYSPCNFQPNYNPIGNQFTGNDIWFNNTPCEYQWFQSVLAMLNTLLRGKSEPQRLAILNMAIQTNIPYQGLDDITLLESAILVRSPSLVARLLALQADPNISTSGIPLVNQIIDATGYDFYNGNFPEDQAIVSTLLRYGANVYPGFPGTTFPGQGIAPYWGGYNNGCNNGYCDY